MKKRTLKLLIPSNIVFSAVTLIVGILSENKIIIFIFLVSLIPFICYLIGEDKE